MWGNVKRKRLNYFRSTKVQWKHITTNDLTLN